MELGGHSESAKLRQRYVKCSVVFVGWQHYTRRRFALSGNGKESLNPILDPDADPDHHRNRITSKMGQVSSSLKISAKSAFTFPCNPAKNQQIHKYVSAGYRVTFLAEVLAVAAWTNGDVVLKPDTRVATRPQTLLSLSVCPCSAACTLC